MFPLFGIILSGLNRIGSFKHKRKKKKGGLKARKWEKIVDKVNQSAKRTQWSAIPDSLCDWTCKKYRTIFPIDEWNLLIELNLLGPNP